MAEEQKKPAPENRPSNEQEGGFTRPSEKSQFLHREEIRSMEKDVTRTREQEAQKERTRIAQIQRQQQEKREKQLSEQIRQKAEEQQVWQREQEMQKREQQMREAAEAREREVAEKVAQQHQQIREEKKQTDEHVKTQVFRQTITPSQPAAPADEQRRETDEQEKQSPSPQQPSKHAQDKTQQSDKETPPKPTAGIGAQTPSSQSRVIVRLAIIIFIAFIIFNAVLFGYWQLQQRGIVPAISLSFPFSFSLPFLSQEKETPAPTPQPEAEEPLAETPEPEVTPPPSPAPESPTPPPAGGPTPAPSSQLEQRLNLTPPITLQFGSQQELASLLKETKQITQSPGLVRLVLQERDTDKQLGAQDFFEIFGVTPPSAVASQLQNDTLFFIHRDTQGSKFGFVVEVSNAAQAAQSLAAWEGSLEASLSPLLSFWNEKDSAYTSSFRESIHKGITIHFQTFSLEDTGIVYALVNNYLIFASSFEGTKALIDELL